MHMAGCDKLEAQQTAVPALPMMSVPLVSHESVAGLSRQCHRRGCRLAASLPGVGGLRLRRPCLATRYTPLSPTLPSALSPSCPPSHRALLLAHLRPCRSPDLGPLYLGQACSTALGQGPSGLSLTDHHLSPAAISLSLRASDISLTVHHDYSSSRLPQIIVTLYVSGPCYRVS